MATPKRINPGSITLISSGSLVTKTINFLLGTSTGGTRTTIINGLATASLTIWVSGDGGVNFLPLYEGDGAGIIQLSVAAQTAATFAVTGGLIYQLRPSATDTGNVFVGC